MGGREEEEVKDERARKRQGNQECCFLFVVYASGGESIGWVHGRDFYGGFCSTFMIPLSFSWEQARTNRG